MAQKINLGKIEQVPVKEVWSHEALGFTPWLSEEENLTELGNACSVDLELIDTESAVGSFAVDIFAREVGTERKVVIENQLADTDHDHLGKIITYAAGKGADIIIWVVAHARDEHRKAIEWLNEHTDDECAFFLVEIEVWRIGESEPAPRFNVIESPNEWARAEKAKEGLSDTERTKLEYWQTYCECAAENAAFSKVMKPQKARPQHVSNLSVGSTKYHLCLLIDTQQERAGVEVCVHEAGLGKFVLLHRGELENALGIKGSSYDKKNKGIRFYENGFDIKGAREKWPEFVDWQLEKAMVLREEMRRIEGEYLSESNNEPSGASS